MPLAVLPRMQRHLLSAANAGLRTSASSHVAASCKSSSDITAHVEDHIRQMQVNIMEELIPQDDSGNIQNLADLNVTSNLGRMTKYYFQQGGKMLRPTVSLLMASACNSAVKRTFDESQLVIPSTSPAFSACRNQYKIGMIAEMIHTASLVHDDVIDEACTRRGSASVNAVWGNKMSVLVGDFILARATQILCSIGRPEVISVMASIIEDLVLGEFMQMSSCCPDATPQDRMKAYLEKTFRKTASLFANSCRSVAILADEQNTEMADLAYQYGQNLGIAFQLVDDLLDIVSTSSEMGKPVAADMKLGLATCPVLYACEDFPELNSMIARKFGQPGDVETAHEMVIKSKGIEKTQLLVKKYSDEAVRVIRSIGGKNLAIDRLVELALEQGARRL